MPTNITDQDSASFFNRLKKLFSSTIIIKQPGEDKLKFFDMNKFQTMSHIKHNRLVPTTTVSGVTQSGVMSSKYGFQLNKNELYFDYECIDGSTIIPTPDKDANKTIKELAELYPDADTKFYVYSYDHENDCVKLGEAHSVRKTKTEMTYKITFDNGKELIATDNHPILMRNGEYKLVKDITAGESVMPLYIKDFYGQGYNHIFSFSKKWKPVHVLVAEQFNRSVCKNEVVHHLDFNKNNNLPSNLKIMSKSDHSSYHMIKINKEILWRPENYENHKKLVGDGNRKSRIENKEKWDAQNKRNSEFQKEHSYFKVYNKSAEHKKIASDTLKLYRSTHPWIGSDNPNYNSNLTYDTIYNAAVEIYKTTGDLFKYDLEVKFSAGSIISRIKNSPNKFKNFKEFKTHIADSLNHKIVSVEAFEVRDVYDLTVDTYHNFGTENCFVHNCQDMDPILASALDIYADNASMRGNNGNVLHIKSQYDDVVKSLENLFFDILDVNYNLWWWVRNTCKYGNHYMKLDIAEGVGVIDVIPLSPYSMTRVENYIDKTVEYVYDDTGGMMMYTAGKKKNFQDYEIVHFRLMADSNFLPYGKSIFEPARRVWKQVQLMEDAMMINRIMRAPQKRIFYIDVGNLAPDAIDTYMQEISDNMKKVPFMDENTGDYNLKYNLTNLLEDFFIPVRGDKAATKIETLDGMEYQGIEDIKYLQNKMFAALKVPRAWLGYEESISSRNTLAGEDVRFAATIERVQRMIEADLTKIAFVHLYTQGYNPEALSDFEISLTPSSNLAELEKLELLEKKISISRDLQELKLFSGNYIYDTLFHMTEDEMNDEITKLVDSTKIKWRLEQIMTTGIDPISEDKKDETEEDVEGPEFDDSHIVDSEEAVASADGEMPSEESDTKEQPEETPKPDEAVKGNLAKKLTGQARKPVNKPNLETGLDGMTLA